jgi:hypothetical protein
VEDEALLFVTSPGKQAGEQGAIRFRGRPLDRALEELAEWSGTAIVLDREEKLQAHRSSPGLPGGAEEGGPAPERPVRRTLVSATFRKGAPAASAARVLAAMAGLDAVALDGVVFVTTNEVAERMRDGLLKEQTAKGVAQK